MTPMTGEIERNTGPSGLCEARIVKDGVKLVTPAGDLFHIINDGIPEWVMVKPGKEMFFSLSKDETRLKALRPYNLSNIALRFVNFAPRKDGIPLPSLQKGGPGRGKWSKSYFRDRLTMTANLSLAVGEYEGMGAPVFLDYIFKPLEGGWTGWIGTAKQVEKWENFARLFGIDFATDSVAFSENVLPAFEALLLERDGFAMGNIEAGTLAALFKPPVGYTIPPRPAAPVVEESADGEDNES